MKTLHNVALTDNGYSEYKSLLEKSHAYTNLLESISTKLGKCREINLEEYPLVSTNSKDLLAWGKYKKRWMITKPKDFKHTKHLPGH